MTRKKALRWIGVVALIVLGLVLAVLLWGPRLQYRVDAASVQIPAQQFIPMLAAMSDARLYDGSRLEVLTNAVNYYRAELQAIKGAQKTINLEAYIFTKGKLTQNFVEALTERARAGVQVRIVLDGVGSLTTRKGYFDELQKAGGQVAFYHPLRWHNFLSYNNRTHRELLVVDGTMGFIGGSGWGDVWAYQHDGKPPWRDTMVRVQGRAVMALQGTFLENWVEATGELISGVDQFPALQPVGSSTTLVVNSTPSTGRSTRSRVLYQTIFASAQKSIRIQTPYFLPDQGARGEMLKARERGVEITVITPGPKIDNEFTRSSSRTLYGDLLKAGVKIYEYQPSMIHVKAVIVDDAWSIVGSTNIDHRSFGLNDEVNLAAHDAEFAARLTQDFYTDLSDSKEITYEDWKNRPVWERIQEAVYAVFERQQ